jgi:uncharacterized protein
MIAQQILLLCLAAFAAGFIDAIVGGGGLIQTPATLLILPQYPIATLLGTTKIPSCTGTSIAAIQYAKRIQVQWKLLLSMCCMALLAALFGSYCVTKISNQFLNPIIFCTLLLVALYTFLKKDFGTSTQQKIKPKHQIMVGIFSALLIGFYDGFIGPGTGSFLVLFFISVLGFDFLKASAHAKFVNLATNTGSILLFAKSGHILYQYAIPMAICNVAGSFIGARLAILKGNQFVRYVFLLVIAATIIRFGYDIFKPQ